MQHNQHVPYSSCNMGVKGRHASIYLCKPQIFAPISDRGGGHRWQSVTRCVDLGRQGNGSQTLTVTTSSLNLFISLPCVFVYYFVVFLFTILLCLAGNSEVN